MMFQPKSLFTPCGCLLLVLLGTSLVPGPVDSSVINENPYKHRQVLDDRGNYILDWEYKPEKKTITFNVTVKTKGYVGLGLAKRESMLEADFMVGGVHKDGKPYCKDMHTSGNRTLIADEQQDWTLLEASEEKGVTCLTFSRPISTCDEDDLEITEGRVVILWAYGENDTLGYHYHNRGFAHAYLLDPYLAPEIDSKGNIISDEEDQDYPTHRYDRHGSKVKRWSLRRRTRLEQKPTSYFCTLHRGMQLAQKHHVIGFRTFLENEVAQRHVHHFVVWRCHAPEGVDPKAMFEPFVDYPGEECHFSENRRLPINFCQDMLFVWGTGGNPLFLDENVGLAVGEDPNEYLLFETHIDNTDLRASSEFTLGVDFYMTPKMRPRDGTMMTIGYDVPGSLAAFPPGTVDFNFVGHCDSSCSKLMFPPSGTKFSAVFLHAHATVRAMKLRHFRNGKELPTILTDDNYNPLYQQFRNLAEEVTILPGDHLIMQCEIDNSQANGTTVTGFGTQQEMCVAFIVADRDIARDRCTSEYPAQRLMAQMGVQNVTWDTYLQERQVTSPSSLRGLTLREVGDLINWTSKKRIDLEKDMLYTPHIMECQDLRVPSAEEIFDRAAAAARAREEEEDIKGRYRRPRQSRRNFGRENIQRVSYSGLGYSRPENDPDLQRDVRRVAQQVRRHGVQGLVQTEDPGAIIFRAALGSPVFIERVPPTGQSWNVPPSPTARFPKNANVDDDTSENQKNACKKPEQRRTDFKDNQAQVNFPFVGFGLGDLQSKGGLSLNDFQPLSVPYLTY